MHSVLVNITGCGETLDEKVTLFHWVVNVTTPVIIFESAERKPSSDFEKKHVPAFVPTLRETHKHLA